MRRSISVPAPEPMAGRRAPAFTAAEKDVIAAWSRAVAARGLRATINRTDYTFLTEALVICAWDSDDPQWIIHKTPNGGVALRLWPGVAEILSTVLDALMRVTAAVDHQQGSSLRLQPANVSGSS